MFEQCNNLIYIKTELKKVNMYVKLFILYAPKRRKNYIYDRLKYKYFKERYVQRIQGKAEKADLEKDVRGHQLTGSEDLVDGRDHL